MLATPGAPPRGDDSWRFEPKWDGCRILAELDHGSVRAWTRRGRNATPWFPELAGVAARHANRRIVLDGEVISPSADGRPDFAQVRRRISGRPRPSAPPVAFVWFDILECDASEVTNRTWLERRRLLESLAADGRLLLSPVFDDYDALLDATEDHVLEGVVAKRVDARYRAGRSGSWLKRKHTRTGEFVVGGVVRTSRCDHALAIGLPTEDGRLAYRGCVELASPTSERAIVVASLLKCRRDDRPFVWAPRWRDVTWVGPRLVVEIRHMVSATSGELREPVLLRAVRVA